MPEASLSAFLSLAALGGLALGYLLGSIPFGLVVTKLAGAQDPRTIGSGNIGATNVLRTGKKGLAAATLLGDALKGTAAVLLAAVWTPEAALTAGAGALLGHVFPVWLGFKGGKGVATYIGALFAAAWPAGLAFAAVWLGTAFISRYSSLSALLACAATPLVLLALGRPGAALVFLLLSVLVIAKHRANIERLLAGSETRIGQKG
jgi:glycerol-3-phosphate acyltransferase PlsY